MLTREENELLCRVGPGTPMGEVFRRYWLPALLSYELLAHDCPPVRVKLLGEDLVAFRDSCGRVGLLAERCSHRRASLFYGRNEACGLRCIYHGWKYDTDGNILGTPAEPAESMLKHHVKHPAYPTHEVNGLVLTYMGPRGKQPLIPNYEWLTSAEGSYVEGKYWNENNWLQSVEGDCDSSHIDYLHRSAGYQGVVEGTLDLKSGFGAALEFEIEQGPWWIKAGATRYVGNGEKYVRTNMFIPPCIGIPPSGPNPNGIASGGFHTIYQLPADDYHTWRIDIHTEPRRRGAPEDGMLQAFRDVGPDWRKFANKGNNHLQNRDLMKTTVYSGIDFGNHVQDACVTESMGPISDRENEHLGSCDAQPKAMRQWLLQIVRDVQAGKDPPGIAFDAADNRFDDLYAVHAVLPPDVPWTDKELVLAHGHPMRRGGG